MMDALALRENAQAQLAQIKTLESGVDYLNKVKAIEVWAKAEKKDAELQNMIAEQKIRTQRILGQLLKESEVSKNAGNGSNQYESSIGRITRPKLNDYGLSKEPIIGAGTDISNVHPNQLPVREIALMGVPVYIKK